MTKASPSCAKRALTVQTAVVLCFNQLFLIALPLAALTRVLLAAALRLSNLNFSTNLLAIRCCLNRIQQAFRLRNTLKTDGLLFSSFDGRGPSYLYVHGPAVFWPKIWFILGRAVG